MGEDGAAKQPAKERLKVIVRKLPPNLSEDGFRSAVEKLIAGKFTWLSYYPGKVSVKRIQSSRAYVNFTSADAVFEFKSAFDGHVFIGSKGNQYQCSVEYAPFQKVPDPGTKKDGRDGTIERDADYLEFVRLLESDEALPSASAQLEEKEKAAGATSGVSLGPNGRPLVITPLMEFLRQRHAANPGLKIGLSRGGGGARFSRGDQEKLDRRDQEKIDKAKREATQRETAQREAAQRESGRDGPKKVLKKVGEVESDRGKRDTPSKSTRGQPSAAAAVATAATAALSSAVPASSTTRGGSAKGSKQGARQEPTQAAESNPPQKVMLLTRPAASAAKGGLVASTQPQPQPQSQSLQRAKSGAKPTGAQQEDPVSQRAGPQLERQREGSSRPTPKSGREVSGRGGRGDGTGSSSSGGAAGKPGGEEPAGAAAAALQALSKMSLSAGANDAEARSQRKPPEPRGGRPLDARAVASEINPPAKVENKPGGESNSEGAPAAAAAAPASTRRVRSGFTAYVPGALRAGSGASGRQAREDPKPHNEEG